MGCDGTMQKRVAADIERLEDRFGSFPVNQTTLSVCESDYETARERADAGEVDLYVRVYNDDGDVLRLRNDREYSVPLGVTVPGEPLAVSVARAVRDAAGVHVAVDGVARVTIAGVNNDGDPDAPTVYRLIALIDAERTDGHVENAVWESDEPAIPEYV